MVVKHEVQADFLQAIGQATRLRILEVLAEGERCVCDIQVAVGEQQSNVSKHLSLMREHGLVKCRREGSTVYYSLSDTRIYDAIKLLIEAQADLIKHKSQLASTNC